MFGPAWAFAVALLAASPVPGLAPTEAALPTAVEGVTQALLAGHDSPGATVAATLRAVAAAQGLEVPRAESCPSLVVAVGLHANRLGLPVPALPLGVPSTLDHALGCLLGALDVANAALDATTAGLTGAQILALMNAEDDPAPQLLELLLGRDPWRNVVAAIQVADALDLALPPLQGLQSANAPLAPLDLAPIVRFEPTGAQLYDSNYALMVDLDGDDTYDNHAGGIFVAVGNAFYDVEPGSEGLHAGPVAGWQAAVGGDTQDADATLSSSLVLDLAGHDTYGVKKAPMLKDVEAACGTGPRVGIVGTIGSGVLGTGMLFDLAGDNHYIGRTQTQGAGHVFGVGVMYSGPGNDSYEGIRAAQGSGLLGGMGFLVDEGGNDAYTLTFPPGGVFNGDRRECDADARYGQGGNFDRKDGPFTPQIGVLAELAGNDVYVSPRKSQGFSQGHGFGLLLEKEGNDSYTSTEFTQGSGKGVSDSPSNLWSGGTGILLELGGNDAYSASAYAQGWGMGTPTDTLPDSTDLNAVLQWSARRDEAVGILLDQAGADTYTVVGRVDGATLVDGFLGVFADAA